MHDTALAIAVIGITALLCQWSAWKAKLPAILFLLLAGLLLGPIFGVLSPDSIFGELLFPLVSLAVAVVLFEGSLTLNFEELGSLTAIVRRMIFIAAPVTWGIIAVTTHYLFNLSWDISVLFGALMVVTGPTVVTPMLRTIRPSARIASILKWEGIVIDPIGALLVVVVYEFIVTQNEALIFSHSLLLFFKTIAIGLVFGLVAGFILGKILSKQLLPEYLQNLATLSVLFLVFTGSNHFAHEAGLLAVTVMGMWLGNIRGIQIHNILNFKENLTILFISGLFIILAARLPQDQLLSIFTLTTLILLIVIQFVARPISVALATLGTTMPWRERALLSWIAPRGIVAAAVSALFALRLTENGFSQAELLLPLTFAVILGTVVFQSATSRFVAKRLNLVEPPAHGVLIVGANTVARTIGLALKQHGVDVILCDSNWDNIRNTRMAGLETFFGNPVSEYADQRLALAGIGNLLALSPIRDQNVIASMHYRIEFGANHIFSIRSSIENRTTEKHKISSQLKGETLFPEDITYSKISSLLGNGAEIRATRLTEEFTMADFLNTKEPQTTLLFALSKTNRLIDCTSENAAIPQRGWILLSLSTDNKSSTPKSV